MLARLYAELAIPTPLGVPLVLRCLMSRLSSVAWCPACPLLFDVPVVRCPRMSWMTFAAWCPVCFLLPDVLYALWLLVYSTPSNVPPRGWKYIIVPDVKTQNPPADLNLDNFTVLKILHRQNIFDSKLNKPPTVSLTQVTFGMREERTTARKPSHFFFKFCEIFAKMITLFHKNIPTKFKLYYILHNNIFSEISLKSEQCYVIR